jgi:glyoxylase-like metal-dependent hydrolase (beta-lactamase superfamily II)
MQTGYYRFNVGAFQCLALSDGSLDYSPKRLFANVPTGVIEETLRARNLPTDHVTTPYTFLYVDTGASRVLVDMGTGNLAPTTGQLPAHLRASGIDPAQIDVVVITHAHPDHVGGALDDDGTPLYANARYWIWQREWDFWFSAEATEMAPQSHIDIARRNLEPLQSRMHFLDDEIEFHPGFQAIQAPGHTPGHLAVLVSSAGQGVLYISDTVLFPLHLEYPDWRSSYDMLPEEAERSKQRVFDLAADEKLLVMGMHFPPFPSLGHVAKTPTGWQWQPIEPGVEGVPFSDVSSKNPDPRRRQGAAPGGDGQTL